MKDFSSFDGAVSAVHRWPAVPLGAPVSAETLRYFTIFADLAHAKREHLLAQMQPLTVPTRAILLPAGQPGHAVYFLLEGTVKIGLERPTGPRTQKPFSIGKIREIPAVPAPATGAQVMLSLCGPGSILGELSVLDGLGHSASVIARQTCRLLWMDKDVFLDSLQETPQMSLALLRECSARLRRATQQLYAYATLDAAGRVAHALLQLTERFGVETPKGLRLDIGLTQPELGDLTGLTRTRVNTAIGIFKKNGWLEQEEGLVMALLDVEQLSAVAHRAFAR